MSLLGEMSTMKRRGSSLQSGVLQREADGLGPTLGKNVCPIAHATSKAFDKVEEEYFGEKLEFKNPDKTTYELIEMQKVAMRLYESRYASTQRCVAFFVLFHSLGGRVAAFWSNVSFGLLGYDMSRTHSIMRIATTASPVSGAEVRDRTKEIAIERRIKNAAIAIGRAAQNWTTNKSLQIKLEHAAQVALKSPQAVNKPALDSTA